MSLLADFGYSARSFARTPLLAATILFTIALGIGSNASVLGFVRGLVTRNLPIERPDNVVSLYARGERDAFVPLSYDTYASLKMDDVFEKFGAVRESQRNVEADGQRSIAAVAEVTPDVEAVLGLSLAEGARVSQRAAAGLFGGGGNNALRIGRMERETRAAGLAPEWLEGVYSGRTIDIWTRLREDAIQSRDRESPSFWALARLRPGVSLNAAQAAIDARRTTGPAIAVLPYTALTPEAASRMSRIGQLLIAAAVVVFVVACANVAVFLLSRASSRAQETAVRVALGAGRRHLGRQLLADAVLLSLAGAAAGFLLAMWTGNIVPALFFQEDASKLVYAPDLKAIVVASGACALVMIACALVPLLEVRADDPASVLRREGRGPSNAMRRLRAGLVVGQMMGCCLLAISTGLLIEGFRTSLKTSAGNRLGKPLLATVQANVLFARPDLGLRYFQEVEAALRKVPGVLETAWVGSLPGSQPNWQSMTVEPPLLPSRPVSMHAAIFVPELIDRLVLPPLAGRMFGGRDTRDGCPAVVANAAAARDVFGDDAVGRVIEDASGRRVEVVGVVEEKGKPGPPSIYYYTEQLEPPLGRTGPAPFSIPAAPTQAAGIFDGVVVSASYFAAMDFEVVAGHALPDERSRCRVAVINQEASERYFGGNAVGGAVIDGNGRRTDIVGVIRAPLLRASQRRVEPAIYFPLVQDYQPRMTLVIGVRDHPDALVPRVRRALEAVPFGDVISATTLDAHLSRTALAPERIATVLVGVSAVTALAIGILGMYGAMSDAVRQRRREIALRIALGAPGSRIVRQVIAEGVRLAAAGAIAGMLGSLTIAAWLARIAPDAGAPAVWVWLAAPAALVGVVLIASVVPVGRALAVDPLTIMRAE